ncbi:MAG: hypothetical protein ACOYW3_01565 [Bacteroidota bacterium]
MKKVTVVVLVAGSILLSSCSFYTCPTYAKKPVKNSEKQTKI